MVLPMSPNTCYPSLRSVQWERAGVRGANPISPSPLSSPIQGEEIIGFNKVECIGIALIVILFCEHQ